MRALITIAILLTAALASQVAAAQTTCLPHGCGAPGNTIDANPYPNVRSLPIDDALLGDRDYRRVNGPYAIHSAPNSPDAETFGDGYSFVTVMEGAWRLGENRRGTMDAQRQPGRQLRAVALCRRAAAAGWQPALHRRLDIDASARLEDARRTQKPPTTASSIVTAASTSMPRSWSMATTGIRLVTISGCTSSRWRRSCR